MAARELNVSQTFWVKGQPGRLIHAVRGTVGVHEYCIGRSRALGTSDGFNTTRRRAHFCASAQTVPRTVLDHVRPPTRERDRDAVGYFAFYLVDGEQQLDLSHTAALTPEWSLS